MQNNSPFSLNGKTILITGASSGIGRQAAISCSNSGAKLILLGRDKLRLDETLSLLTAPENHSSYCVDLTDYDGVEATVKQIAQNNKINGLIHCAGISATLPLRLITPEKTDAFFRTNVTGAIHLTKLICKPLNFADTGGSIVFISSVMGSVGESGKTLYSLTKGALNAGAKSLAIELASRKIRVNCISPGVVLTPMSLGAVYSQDESLLKRVSDMHPLGLGHTEDIANACIYLLSDASKWVTGINLHVDGGYTSK